MVLTPGTELEKSLKAKESGKKKQITEKEPLVLSWKPLILWGFFKYPEPVGSFILIFEFLEWASPMILIFFLKYPQPAVLWKINELHNTGIYQCWVVLTFLWEPAVLGSLIYNVFGLVRTGQVIKNFFFSNSPGSQIGQLSYIQQQPVFTTWLFIFSVIKISFNFSDDDFIGAGLGFRV